MDFLNKVLEFINQNSAVAITVGAVIAEILLRLIKSDKFQSVFRLVPKILGVLVAILGAVANILDKVVPDRPAE